MWLKTKRTKKAKKLIYWFSSNHWDYRFTFGCGYSSAIDSDLRLSKTIPPRPPICNGLYILTPALSFLTMLVECTPFPLSGWPSGVIS